MIPLVDLKAQYRAIQAEIDAAVARVFARGQYVLGPEVAAFEAEFAAYCQAPYAVGVRSGTSALHLALLAAGVGPGDEVITVPFTFAATVAAICETGARPVFVDIDPVSYTIDVEQIERAVTRRTRAIIPVHLYGQPADLDPVLTIAARFGLIVIEDAAQAHGAEYKGRRVGAIGHIGCFSFYPSKNLGACGEGGMVVTADASVARMVRMLRNCGQEQRYHHLVNGYNDRLDELQAAILRVKLRYLDEWNAARRRHAARYGKFLRGAVQAPIEQPYARHVYHIYAIRTSDRDAAQLALLTRGVQTGIHYPIPVHLQPAYAHLGYQPGDFPNAEQAAREVLSLPIYPEISAEAIEQVCAVVREECHEPSRMASRASSEGLSWSSIV